MYNLNVKQILKKITFYPDNKQKVNKSNLYGFVW